MWSEHKGIIIGGVVLCLICVSAGFGVAYYFGQKELHVDQPAQEQAAKKEPRNGILVHDQVVTDDVLIDSVTISQPSFVAIHANNAGKPGDVIAVSKLLSSSKKNSVIVLPEKLQIGEKYFVLLHADDGDGIHTFPGRDTLVSNDTNKPLIASFVVQAP